MLGAQKFLDAVKAGDMDVVKRMLLIEPRLANAHADAGPSAVMLAMYHGRAEVRDLLVGAGARLGVHEAAAAGEVDRLKALASEDASAVNAPAPDGFAPLALAAFFGQPRAVEWLIEHGAEVNAVSKNATGYTALSGAVARGDTDIVRLLLAKGANAAHRYGPGYSALHEAAASGKLEIAKLLLEHGAHPNAATEEGHTPLSLAEEKGHAEIAKLLRDRGAVAKAV